MGKSQLTVLCSSPDYIILFLMYAYGGGVGLMFLLISVGTWGGLYVLGSGLVPIETLQYLQGSTIGIFAISKIPQIIANFQVRHDGFGVDSGSE
jgi:hypothetical protein